MVVLAGASDGVGDKEKPRTTPLHVTEGSQRKDARGRIRGRGRRNSPSSIKGTTHTGYLSQEHPVGSVELLDMATEWGSRSSYRHKEFTEFLSPSTSDGGR